MNISCAFLSQSKMFPDGVHMLSEVIVLGNDTLLKSANCTWTRAARCTDGAIILNIKIKKTSENSIRKQKRYALTK